MDNKPLAGSYNGYTSCPVLTGYGKLVLCEFDYNNQPTGNISIRSEQRKMEYVPVEKKNPTLVVLA